MLDAPDTDDDDGTSAPTRSSCPVTREQPRKKARTSEAAMQQPPGRAADAFAGAGQEAQSHETEQGEEGQVLEKYFRTFVPVSKYFR
jgi:hypothetical protein